MIAAVGTAEAALPKALITATQRNAATINTIPSRSDCLGAGEAVAVIPSRSGLLEPLQQVVAHPECIRHDRERGIHRRAGREERSVDHVEIVDLMRAAVPVEHRGLRIMTEPARSILVADAFQAGCAS